MKRVVVLGGGIAGLAAARSARRSGADVVLLEKNPTLGGLTRSIVVDGWTFDYAGHFLHLSRISHPAQLGEGGHACARRWMLPRIFSPKPGNVCLFFFDAPSARASRGIFCSPTMKNCWRAG